MNSDVHPAVAALVLALTALAVALWVWANGVAASYGGPAEMKTSPDGHHFIQIQSYLIEHDQQGRYRKTHDLRQFGVDIVLGTFGFFSNGDVLLRKGPDPRSLWDNLRAYGRRTNQSDIEPETADSGLYRCELETRRCTRLGNPGVDFKAAHGLSIDWSTDQIYISDTTRHVLRKYSAEGVQTAGPVPGFRFPNQIVRYDGMLLVADTNHHVIRAVDLTDARFGETLREIDVVPTSARRADQIWPSHFARVGDSWWVNNMTSGMNAGGLYIFDDDWTFQQRAELPPEADPIALLLVNDEVWVSDWNNDVVRRFDTAGNVVGMLQSAGLDAVLAEAHDQRQKYRQLGYAGVALLLLVFAALGVRAFAIAMNRQPPEDAGTAATGGTVEQSLDEIAFEPSAKGRRRLMIAYVMAALMMLMLIALPVYVGWYHQQLEIALRLSGYCAVLLGFTGLIVWVERANTGTRITASGDSLTLLDHTGRRSTCTLDKVRYDTSAIATPDAVVYLGRPLDWVYDHKHLQAALWPRLKLARSVSAWQVQKILFQMRHPQAYVTIVALVAAVIAAVFVLARNGL